MTSALLGIGGTIVAAVLAFVLGRVNLRHANEVERQEALRAERLTAYAAFCSAIVEYRRAQLHRWYVGHDLADPDEDPDPGASARRVEQERPEVAQDVRGARAKAWGCFYRVLMICTDGAVVAQARQTLKDTKQMKYARTDEEAEQRSDDVHDQVDAFARLAGASVLAHGTHPLAPAADISGVGVSSTT